MGLECATSPRHLGAPPPAAYVGVGAGAFCVAHVGADVRRWKTVEPMSGPMSADMRPNVAMSVKCLERGLYPLVGPNPFTALEKA